MSSHNKSSPDVVEAIHRFMSNTLVSKRNNSKLLGISASSLIRWLEEDTLPYEWTAEQVMRRIAIFDEADRKTNLYQRLVSMTPRERMEELAKVLEEHTDSPDA